MEDELPVPELQPPLPRHTLCIALAFPSLVPCAWSLWTAIFRNNETLPEMVGLANMLAIVAGGALFNSMITGRYRGISLIFLECSYLLGQIFVCIALWIGFIMLREWLDGAF